MSSEATSSPVSASTLAYLMRWPVLRLIWLNETFSVSEVAGSSATGQVTTDSRRKPFQLARGAMGLLRNANDRGTATITPGAPKTNPKIGRRQARGRESLNDVNRESVASPEPPGCRTWLGARPRELGSQQRKAEHRRQFRVATGRICDA